VASRLEAVSWTDVPERVMVPGWRQAVARSRGELERIEAGGLPLVISDLPGFVARVVPAQDRPPEADLQRSVGVNLLATGLALTLYDSGWVVSAPPGEPVVLESDGNRISPFAEVGQLADGTLTSEEWRERCERRGIAAMRLSAPPEVGLDAGVSRAG
jgi:hypothetical protein